MTHTKFLQIVDDFFSQFMNASLDYDGKYGAQCKDVFSAFNCDWLDLPYLYGNACQLWDNSEVQKYYDQVPNSPTGIPPKGSWVIWSSKVGSGAGHVGQATGDGDVNRFKSFDQNWPSGSVCHFQEHNYNNVLGWLVPKNINESEDEMIDQNYVNGELYKTDSGMVLWHIPNPDVANKYFHDWGTQKPITDIVPVKEVVKEVPVEKIVEKPVEVIKEVPVEKIVEVEVPKEITTEIIKQVKVETPLPEDEQRVLEIYRKIKSYFERNKK